MSIWQAWNMCSQLQGWLATTLRWSKPGQVGSRWHTSAPIRGPWHHAWPCPSGRLGQSLAPEDHWGSDLSEEMRWRARPWRSSKLGSTDPSRCLGRLPHSNLRCSGRSSWWSAPWAAWRGSLTGSWCSERRLHPGKPSLEGPWSSPANWNDYLLQVRQSNSLVGHFPSPPTLSESSWAPSRLRCTNLSLSLSNLMANMTKQLYKQCVNGCFCALKVSKHHSATEHKNGLKQNRSTSYCNCQIKIHSCATPKNE